MRLLPILALLALPVAIPVSAAQPAPAASSRALTGLFACKAIGDVAQRAACYDREVEALQSAEARRDVVVVNRDEMQKTRRSLFGLSLPDLGIFGNDSKEAIDEIDGRIRSVSRNPYGKWSFVLEDGGVWAQTDTRKLAQDPRPGHAVHIRRAALGSFLAKVEGQPAIRIQRVR